MGLFTRRQRVGPGAPVAPNAATHQEKVPRGSRARREPLVLPYSQRPPFGQWLKATWLDILTMVIMGAIGLGVYEAHPAPSRSFPVSISFPFAALSDAAAMVISCSFSHAGLLPRRRNRLSTIRLPRAQRNCPHLGGCASGLPRAHLLHPRLPNPRALLLGHEQRHHRPPVLAHLRRRLPGLPQVAHWGPQTSLFDRLQAGHPTRDGGGDGDGLKADHV